MKFCTSCGAELEDSSKFCTSCGAPCVEVEDEPTSAGLESTSELSTQEVQHNSAAVPGAAEAVMFENTASKNSSEITYEIATEEKSVKTETEEKPKSKAPIFIGVAVGLVAVVAVIVAVFFVVLPQMNANSEMQTKGILEVFQESTEEGISGGFGEAVDAVTDEIEAAEEAAAAAAAANSTIPYLSSSTTGSYPGLVIPFADITASSVLESSDYGSYEASNVRDSSNSTAWVEGDPGNGAGSTITFSNPTSSEPISEMAIRTGYCKSEDLYYQNARPYQVTIFADGTPIGTATLLDSYAALQIVYFKEPVTANSITVRIDSVYNGSKWDDCAITSIGFK